jgi:hypothetical protein
MTTRWTRAAGVFALAAAVAASIVAAPAPKADPIGCDFNRTCSYDPQWNGPMLPTWDTPGSNNGWTTLPQICDPITHRCGQYATP